MTKHALSLWFFEHVCGCGNPEDTASLMRDVLEAVADDDLKRRFARLGSLLPDRHYNTTLNYFDHIGLLEHGGSLPGWLTDTGEQVLAALKTHGTDTDAWGKHCSASSDGRCIEPCPESVPR